MNENEKRFGRIWIEQINKGLAIQQALCLSVGDF